jgi:hypothetical protein
MVGTPQSDTSREWLRQRHEKQLQIILKIKAKLLFEKEFIILCRITSYCYDAQNIFPISKKTINKEKRLSKDLRRRDVSDGVRQVSARLAMLLRTDNDRLDKICTDNDRLDKIFIIVREYDHRRVEQTRKLAPLCKWINHFINASCLLFFPFCFV